MTARIFISHSTKGAEPEPPPGDADAVLRHERLAYARKVRDLVYEELRDLGYEVWLDQKTLRPGAEERWRATLHRWLGTCDGALLLLDKESVKSEWVWKEAAIITWRRSLNSKLRLVPAFLGDFRASDLADGRLEMLQIGEDQAVRLPSAKLSDANANDLAGKIVEAFGSLEPDAETTQMSVWLHRVADLVAAAGPASIKAAATALGVDDDDIAEHAGGDVAELVAHQLLNVPLETVVCGLAELAQGTLSHDQLRSLLELTFPTWVDVRAAEHLCRLAYGSPRVPVVVINAKLERTGSEYVTRAVCGDRKVRSMAFGWAPLGEEDADSIFARYEEILANEVGLHPLDRDQLRLWAEKYGDREFVLVGNEALRADVLDKLCGAYPQLTYVLMPGTSTTGVAELFPGLAVVEPLLSENEESRVVADRLEAQRLYGGG